MWKWIVGTFVGIAIVCGGGGFLLTSSDGFQKLVNPPEKAIEVRLETVVVRDLVRTVGAPGTVQPRRIVKLSAQVSARIEELPFEEGARVNAGDVVVRLDDEELQARLESAEANLKVQEARVAEAEVQAESARASLRSELASLEGARAAYDQASAEAGRVRELFDSKDRSQADLDRAEAAFQQEASRVAVAQAGVEIAEQNVKRAEAGVLGARAAVEVARADIRAVRKDLENATIVSPIDGIITTLNSEVGELVVVGTMNNAASVIMEIADLSEMILEARVDEANVSDVRPGQSADVFINAYPGTVFRGEVRRVGKQRKTYTDQTRYFETEIVIEMAEGQTLPAGLTASCDIYVQTIPDAIQVPSQAVLSRRIADLPKDVIEGNDLVDQRKTFTYVVYTVREGRARPVPVDIGPSDLKNTILEAGLGEGDLVIAGPYKILEELKDGQLVKVEGVSGEVRTVGKAASGPESGAGAG